MMMRTLKVIVGGEGNVGKTSLIRQYAKAKFSEARNITLGIDVTTQEFTIDDHEVKLAIWDIEGQAGNRPNFFLGAQAAMLVYDVTVEGSLQALTEWYGRCKRYCPDAPIIVVGNKIDLGLQFPPEVPRTFAYYAGAQHGFVSAKTGENVGHGFELLAREAMLHAGVLEPSA
ncbi:MAG: Rab family GTPase, partial [Chloroflexota bacterium]